jgi:hypothetical protein
MTVKANWGRTLPAHFRDSGNPSRKDVIRCVLAFGGDERIAEDD